MRGWQALDVVEVLARHLSSVVGKGEYASLCVDAGDGEDFMAPKEILSAAF